MPSASDRNFRANVCIIVRMGKNTASSYPDPSLLSVVYATRRPVPRSPVARGEVVLPQQNDASMLIDIDVALKLQQLERARDGDTVETGQFAYFLVRKRKRRIFGKERERIALLPGLSAKFAKYLFQSTAGIEFQLLLVIVESRREFLQESRQHFRVLSNDFLKIPRSKDADAASWQSFGIVCRSLCIGQEVPKEASRTEYIEDRALPVTGVIENHFAFFEQKNITIQSIMRTVEMHGGCTAM